MLKIEFSPVTLEREFVSMNHTQIKKGAKVQPTTLNRIYRVCQTYNNIIAKFARIMMSEIAASHTTRDTTLDSNLINPKCDKLCAAQMFVASGVCRISSV